MRLKRSGRVATIVAAGVLLLSGCAVNERDLGSAPASALSGTLVGTGSSAQQAAQEVWIAGFQSDNPNVTIEYDPAGSGAGRDTFLAGGSAFAGTDRAFTDEEVAEGEFASCVPDTGIIELPTFISPIAIIFNLEGIESLNLDAETIAGIFKGTITSWDDEAIAAQNEGVDLPSTAITPVHRADDSGTTENFTDYLHAAAPAVWEAEPDGVWPYDGGEAAPQTSGVVDAVRNGTGTIGYADASRAGDLGVVSVKVGGEYVPYSSDAAAAIVDVSPFVEGRSAGDLAIELERTSAESGVYPIVLISYLVGCSDYIDSDQAELAKAYFSYVISDQAQHTAEEAAGIAPISPTLFERASAAVETIR